MLLNGSTNFQESRNRFKSGRMTINNANNVASKKYEHTKGKTCKCKPEEYITSYGIVYIIHKDGKVNIVERGN